LDLCLTFRFYSDFLFPFSVCEIGLLAFGLLSKISEFSDCEFSTTHNFGGLPQHRSLPQPAQHLQHAVLAETARPPVQWSSVLVFLLYSCCSLFRLHGSGSCVMCRFPGSLFQVFMSRDCSSIHAVWCLL
jgi:hypothetical protein